MKIYSENKKAYHDYSIVERMEVGIVLSGTEVKSICNHGISLNGSYVSALKGELWLMGCNISKYGCGSWMNHVENRNRKLLCHKKEMLEIRLKTESKGLTAVPLKVYDKNGKIKVEIGLARGRNKSDKREFLKEKQIKKEMER